MLAACSNKESGRGYSDSSSTSSMIRIAKKARKTGNPEAAISFYNKALEMDRNNTEAYLGLAEAYIDTNLLDAAVEYIKKAEGRGCDKKCSSYLRGKILLLSGDAKEAEKQFLSSKSVDSINALGAIYDESGDHKKAQSMYKQVITMDPTYIDAYNNMGLSLLLCERYRDAIFYLENACSLPESNITYRSNLALAYGLSGNIQKAKTVYAQDFEGEELEEKISYLEDLLASRQSQPEKQKL